MTVFLKLEFSFLLFSEINWSVVFQVQPNLAHFCSYVNIYKILKTPFQELTTVFIFYSVDVKIAILFFLGGGLL